MSALALTACGSGSGGSDDVLVLYATSVIAARQAAEDFEAETGIKVEVITGSSGEVFGRIQSEASNPQGDVYFGPGSKAVESPDLFEVYESPELENIDPQWISDGDPVPVEMWINAIMYNKDLVGPDEVPTSFFDLADPKWRGQIQSADPAESTAAYGQMVAIYNAGGWDLVEEVAANLIISDNLAGPRTVSDGESALGLFHESAADNYSDNPAVGITHAKEGHTAGWDSLLLVKGTKREANAKRFIDWFLSESGQQMLADDVGGLRPTRVGVVTPSDMTPIEEITVIDFPEDSLTNKDEWLSTWEEIITNL